MFNRTTKYKLTYVLVCIVLVCAVVLTAFKSEDPLIVVFLASAILFIPGRVQGWLWWDFFKGRRLLASGRREESIEHFDKFLKLVRERPWLKKMIWLSWGMYTRDIEVMTLGNLGAAYIEVGKPDLAEQFLREAISLDPEYPIAYYNLGQLAGMRGDLEQANEYLLRARKLGYASGAVDKMISQLGQTFADLEG